MSNEVEVNTKPKKDVLKKNVIFNVFYHILVIVVPLITAPYLSRVLKTDGMGVYSYTGSLATFFAMFAAFGILTYGTMIIAQNRDNKKDYSQKFFEIELLAFILCAVVIGVWIIFASVYTEYKIYLYILTFQILATAFDISWLYAGLEKYSYTVSINLIAKLATMACVFIFVKTKDDLSTYLLINSLGLLGGNLTMWLFLPKVLTKAKIKFSNLKVHLKETFIFFVPTIAATIYSILDKALIGVLIQGEVTVIEDGVEVKRKLAEIENGYYEQTFKILNAAKAICFIAINNVMCSRASYLYKKQDNEGINRLMHVTYHLTLFLSFGMAFGLAAVSGVLIPLYFGPGYDKSIILTRILAFIIPIICISNVLGSIYYTPSGRRKQSSTYLVIGAIVNVLLNIPFILLFNSIGAAIASITAETIITILYLVKCNKTVTWKEMFNYTWKKVVAGLLMLTVILLMNHFLIDKMKDYVLLILTFGVGLVTYILSLVVLKDDIVKIAIGFINKKRGKKNGSEAGN